jgi:hypothetical protein
MMFLTSCSTHYSQECLWYEEVKLTDGTKEWLKTNNPPRHVIDDLVKIADNNDMYNASCIK